MNCSIEIQACRRPIIAYGKGGALETFVNKEVGVFFNKQEIESVVKGIEEFEKLNLNTQDIYKHAMKFNRERFKKEIKLIIGEKNDKNTIY